MADDPIFYSKEDLIGYLTRQPCQKRLILMAGPQGSGKSILARSIRACRVDRFKLFKRLSADKISKRNPASSEGAIMAAYTARLEKWLSKGLNIVDDNLNATRAARDKTIARARSHGYTDIAIVFFEVPLSACIENNRSRQRPVAQWVVERVWRQFNGPGRPSSQEALVIRFVPLTNHSFIQEHTAELGHKPKGSFLTKLCGWVRALFR